jgi:predicted metal-binding membrane protein
MLLMFAAGFASVAWMAGLTLLMFYEARGRQGHTVARLSGVLLIWLAVLTTISGTVPGWVSA